MLIRTFLVVAVPLLLGGVVYGRNSDTGDEIAKPGGAAPAAEATSAGPQQGLAAKESARPQAEVVRFRLIGFPVAGLPLRIDAVEPGGSAQISLNLPEREAAQMARDGLSPAMLFGLTEGYYLGLTGLPPSVAFGRFGRFADFPPLEDAKVMRVQMTEVHEGAKFTVRLGREAARQLKQGDSLFLLRPGGSSTAQLQAVPDVIPVVDARGEVLGMDPRTAALLSQSETNLKQIGLAMHNFHDANKCFPPAVVYGPDGKPWHSWRVLILPYLDQAPLYQRYKFDEPWDGPNNKTLLESMPPVYRDPIYGESKDPYTHYAVAVGKGTAFRPEGHRAEDPRRWGAPRMGTGIADFRDGTSFSILAGLVSPERKIPWMKPEDLTFDESFPAPGKEGSFAAPYKTDMGSGGAFLRADGGVVSIRDDIDLETWRRLFQIADGHSIGEIPTLRPTPDYRRRQIPILEIRRGKPGASARLVFEQFTPEEPRPPVTHQTQSSNNLKPLDAVPAARPPRPVAASEAVAPAVEAALSAAVVPPPWPPATPEEAVAEIKKLGGNLLVKGFKSSWSPDARRLAFGKTPPGSGICVVEVETGKVKELDPTGKDPA